MVMSKHSAPCCTSSFAGGASGGGSAAAADAAPTQSADLLDGPGRYELVGIVSHIGANTACGHYVCHVKKEVRRAAGCCWGHALQAWQLLITAVVLAYNALVTLPGVLAGCHGLHRRLPD